MKAITQSDFENYARKYTDVMAYVEPVGDVVEYAGQKHIMYAGDALIINGTGAHRIASWQFWREYTQNPKASLPGLVQDALDRVKALEPNVDKIKAIDDRLKAAEQKLAEMEARP